MTIQAKVLFDEERKLWLALVYEVDNTIITPLTLGFEATREEAIAWSKEAIAQRAWETGDAGPPDIYDRANTAKH
jgi:hypothetical protein